MSGTTLGERCQKRGCGFIQTREGKWGTRVRKWHKNFMEIDGRGSIVLVF